MKRLLFVLLGVIAVEFRMIRAVYSLSRMMVSYICGALTELPENEKVRVRSLYSRLADVVAEILGEERRSFVPHEHYDPDKHSSFTPPQVYLAEIFQVMLCTSRLVVVARTPSWGGGMEILAAIIAGVPVDLLCERGKLFSKPSLISRLMRGGPGISIIEYEDGDDADAVFEYRNFLVRNMIAA